MFRKVITGLAVLPFLLCSCSNRAGYEQPNEDYGDVVATAEDSAYVRDTLSVYFERKNSRVRIKGALAEDKTGICVYFSIVRGKARNLKMYIQYGEHDVYQFNINNERYSYKTVNTKGSGDDKICWYDYKVRTMDMRFIRALIKAQSVRVVFSDGTSELISRETLDGIEKTLRFYELLGGKYPPYM
jgi:hypothetical protein